MTPKLLVAAPTGIGVVLANGAKSARDIRDVPGVGPSGGNGIGASAFGGVAERHVGKFFEHLAAAAPSGDPSSV